MLSVHVEQRDNVKFCVKLGKSAKESYDLLEKFHGDECSPRIQFFGWFKRFKVPREETGDNHRHGGPSLSKIGANIEKVGLTLT